MYPTKTDKPAQVDSAWIVSSPDMLQPLRITKVPSGNYIDISQLDRGYYQLRILERGCLYAGRFLKQDTAITKELDILTFYPKLISPHAITFSLNTSSSSLTPHIDSLWIVG